ncbi:MAG: hypothetical protein HC897_08525 [Thermoanaerobaculia bacterium]|nr:hypothetical protein [Thermoanaerobaculia bacterium]
MEHISQARAAGAKAIKAKTAVASPVKTGIVFQGMGVFLLLDPSQKRRSPRCREDRGSKSKTVSAQKEDERRGGRRGGSGRKEAGKSCRLSKEISEVEGATSFETGVKTKGRDGEPSPAEP